MTERRAVAPPPAPTRLRTLSAPAAALTGLVVLLVLLLTAADAASGRDADRRASAAAAAQPAFPPRQPIRSDRGRGGRAAGPVTIRGRTLVSGRPGQRLRVRIRVRRSLGAADRVRVRLRRIVRDDPRHPGASIGGELAGSTTASTTRRRARTRLRRLNPLPGPHRLSVRIVEAGGEPGARVGGTRVEVLPQNRQVIADGERRARAVSAPRARAAAPGRPAPARRALGSGALNHDLSFRPGSEASSAIAVDRDDPDRAIAAANYVGTAPRAFITDRGFAAGSVRERRIPARARLPDGSEATLSLCCDPAVAADAAGNLWLAAAAADAGGRIAVNRVAAGSSAFRASSVGLPIAAGASAQAQPTLAVRGGDRIAAAWIETLGGVQNVVLSQCDISADVAACDAAGAWTKPVPVTSASGLYAMPAIEFGPGGDLYAVWWDAGADNAVEIDRCRPAESCSAAASWDEETVIAALDSFDDDRSGGPDPLPLFCPIIAAPGGFVNPAPDLGIGPDGTVVVAYGDLRDNPDPATPSRCRGGGEDKTWDSFVAAGAAPGAPPTPNSGVRVSADAADAVNDHFLPALSVDPATGTVEVTYYSTAGDRSGQRATREYAARSGNGSSFATRATISSAASRFSGPLSDGVDYGARQGADSAAGQLRVVWTDNRALQGRDTDLYALGPPAEAEIATAPTGTVATATNAFTFSTQAPRLQCSVDGLAFRACQATTTVGPLPNGPHTVAVQATDRAGNLLDPAPAAARWAIDDRDPPETTITGRPRAETKRKRPWFEFVADEPEARFKCSYDDGQWRACRSPKHAKVTVGRHRFGVQAIDVGGNVDPTPAFVTFKRKRECGKRDRRGKC